MACEVDCYDKQVPRLEYLNTERPTFRPKDIYVAGSDDLQQIVDLLEESAAWMVSIGITRWQPGDFIASQDNLKNAIETGTVYVWKVSGRVLGTIRLTDTDDAIWGTQAEPALYVHKLSISRSLKGRGLGPRLLNWAEDVAISRSLGVLRLDCWAENKRLCSFYDRCGFRRAGLVRVEGWLHQLFEKNLPPRRHGEEAWTGKNRRTV